MTNLNDDGWPNGFTGILVGVGIGSVMWSVILMLLYVWLG